MILGETLAAMDFITGILRGELNSTNCSVVVDIDEVYVHYLDPNSQETLREEQFLTRELLDSLVALTDITIEKA